MDINYRGITMYIRSIPAVTPQQATPSRRYFRKFHLQNHKISAVLRRLSSCADCIALMCMQNCALL